MKTPPAFSFCMLVAVLHRDCFHKEGFVTHRYVRV